MLICPFDERSEPEKPLVFRGTARRMGRLPVEWGGCPQNGEAARRMGKLPVEPGGCPQNREIARRIRGLPAESVESDYRKSGNWHEI